MCVCVCVCVCVLCVCVCVYKMFSCEQCFFLRTRENFNSKFGQHLVIKTLDPYPDPNWQKWWNDDWQFICNLCVAVLRARGSAVTVTCGTASSARRRCADHAKPAPDRKTNSDAWKGKHITLAKYSVSINCNAHQICQKNLDRKFKILEHF